VNFYNEIDPGKAEWLRQLIVRGVIAEGVVDERSIEQIQPGELAEFTQCHFFAGIGVWSYALRLAGFKDEWPVWTGSCPCQPFSVAGKQKGAMDERHLWPAWFRLIGQCRPGLVFGEQVSDGDGITWLDAVQTDMESAGYRFGPCVLPAAGFGAPHERHRTIFVADTKEVRSAKQSVAGNLLRSDKDNAQHGCREELSHGGRRTAGDGTQGHGTGFDSGGTTGDMAQSIEIERRGKQLDVEGQQSDGSATGRHENTGDPERDCEAGDMADAQNSNGGGELTEGTQNEDRRSRPTGDGETGDMGDADETRHKRTGIAWSN
jgi:site-specific DNA-cytosine methylase